MSPLPPAPTGEGDRDEDHRPPARAPRPERREDENPQPRYSRQEEERHEREEEEYWRTRRDRIAPENAVNIAKLQAMPMPDLNKRAKEMGIENFGTMRKHELIFQ